MDVRVCWHTRQVGIINECFNTLYFIINFSKDLRTMTSRLYVLKQNNNDI